MEINPDPTMGVEVELLNVSPPDYQYLDGVRIRLGNDGSIRRKVFVVDNVPILPLDEDGMDIFPSGISIDRNRVPDRGYGTELITDPYKLVDLEPGLRRMASLYGHLPSTPRSSIHVHVDVGNTPWTFVQRLIAWFIYLEAPLYRLSALGDVHRGTLEYDGTPNDHMYARPLSNSIGLRNEHGKRVPMIDTVGLLKARSASELLAYWGRLDTLWKTIREDHYNPHRLHGLNIASIIRQGTIEWRIWNGVYRFLPQIPHVCLGVYRLAMRKDPRTLPNFEVMVLGSKPDYFSAQQLTDLLELEVDIGDMWGYTSSSTGNRGWVEGCAEVAKFPHYKEWITKVVPSLAYSKQAFYQNNEGATDDGTANFPLYVRNQPHV